MAEKNHTRIVANAMLEKSLSRANFGQFLKALRETAGLTETDMCRELGVSARTYESVELNHYRPAYTWLYKIKNIFELTDADYRTMRYVYACSRAEIKFDYREQKLETKEMLRSLFAAIHHLPSETIKEIHELILNTDWS